MHRESLRVRQGRKVVFTDCKTGAGLEEILENLVRDVLLEP
jgi:Ni2+-binding GTPase involved in maturation of urease and hydrogenase